MNCTRAVTAAGLALALSLPAWAAQAQNANRDPSTTSALPQFSRSNAPQFSNMDELSAPAEETPEQPSAADPTASPVGAGAGWDTQVEAAPVSPKAAYEARVREVVTKVNDYFNGIVNLQGRFVQTDPDQKQSKGKFYVQRPGLLRFDYAPPSRMRIVADGRYLSIENHDLNTIDKYPLEATPFRMLLRSDVDLLRDARILNFSEHDGTVFLTIEDRSGESAGQLQLVFALAEGTPGVELKEWIITDPQGLNTRIQLADLERGKEIARDFFAAAAFVIPTRQ